MTGPKFTRGSGGESAKSSDPSERDSDDSSPTTSSSDFQRDQRTSQRVGGTGDTTDEPSDTNDSSNDNGGSPVDTSNNDFEEDRQSSRRVRGTGSREDTGSQPRGDFSRDQQASQRVGGTGDPADTSNSGGGDDFREDQRTSRQVGGDGGARERASESDTADQSFLIESDVADSNQSDRVASTLESEIEEQYGVSDATVTAGGNGFVVEVDQKFDPEAGREREINEMLDSVSDEEESRYGQSTERNAAKAAEMDVGFGGGDDGETGKTQTGESDPGSEYEGKDRSGFMLEVEKATDAAVDIAFQEETSESIARTFKFSEERVSDDTNITGPGINPTGFLSDNEGVFQSGGDGELNTDITDSLTDAGGLISEEREQELREEARRSQEFYGLGDEADDLVTGVTGSEKAGNVARGVGNIPGDAMAASEYATIGIETGIETAENFGETADEYGTRETGEAIVEGLAQTGDAAITNAQENPYQFAGEVGGEIVLGGAAFKGIERAGDLASSKRTARKADTVVDIDEVSDPSTRGQTVGSGNPEFSRGAVRDTDTAVEEFTEQARKAPDEVKDATESEELIYHGTRADFPDSGDITAGDRSEVAGQFFAADVSPLRLSDEGSSSILPRDLGDLKPRRPDIGDDRNVVATEPKRIEAVPDDLGGSRTPGKDLDKPVRETDRLGREQVVGREKGSVSEYMTEKGGDGEAFVMPKGTRTPEQEAVIPEGTTFQKTDTTIGVRLESGDVIPMRKYRYGDSDVDADAGSATSQESTRPSDVEVSDLPTSQVSRDRSGSVFAGGSVTGVTLGSIPGGSGRGGSTPTGAGSGPSSPPMSPPSSIGGGSPSGGSGGSGSGPLSPPSSPPTGGGSGGPSGGSPSGPSFGSPTGPPSGGSSSPPSGPPSSGTPTYPGYPGTPSQSPPSSPRFDIDIADNSDKDDFESPFGGVKSQSFTDFVDPLTGEVLKTEAGD